MTIKRFVKTLEKLTEDRFLLTEGKEYDLPDDHVVLAGEDDTEVFILWITKVE